MKRKILKRKIWISILAILVSSKLIQAQELVVFNDILTVAEKHNGIYTFQAPKGGGDNWNSPYDYYQGKIFMRYEVIDYPSQSPLMLNVCIWSDVKGYWESWKETCSPLVLIKGNGVYYSESTPLEWWKLDKPVDFSRVKDFKELGLVLFCEGRGNMSSWDKDTTKCWSHRKDYLPLKIRLTVINVAKGFSFSGWEKFGLTTEKKSLDQLLTPNIRTTALAH